MFCMLYLCVHSYFSDFVKKHSISENILSEKQKSGDRFVNIFLLCELHVHSTIKTNKNTNINTR